jgi:hypothetical protein
VRILRTHRASARQKKEPPPVFTRDAKSGAWNFDQLNCKLELSRKEKRFSLADAEWGKLPDEHVVGKPVPLFPRIEL